MKRIVICSDGTWNKPDQKDRGIRTPSNVVKTARAVLPLDSKKVPQVVFYDEGVGSSRWTMDKMLGGASGVGLSKNICDCYRFLSHNYVQGDEIYLFGFSRGAYTVRSFSGFLNTVGLLPKKNIFFLNEAFDLYREYKSRREEINKFKKKYELINPKIKFIGVWDTVGSLGIPLGLFQKAFGKKHQFHDTSLGENIENAFHALAIDEKRKPFAPTLWTKTSTNKQILNQTWFAGVHTNIGGGYEKDGLANCALNWMLDNASKLGLEFDHDFRTEFDSAELDELRDSFKFPFSLLGKYDRPIGSLNNESESVDQSALNRLESDKKYRPSNLLSFLK